MMGLASARARTVLQMEAAECGAACLAMVLSAHGREIALEDARERCGTSRDGVDAAALARAGESYGLKVKAVRREPEDLAKLPLPAILHWNFNHFVVLEEVRGGRFVLLDPAVGRRVVDRRELGEALTGLVLVMAPGEGFRPGGRRPMAIPALVRQAAGSWDAMAIVFACGVVGIVPGLILSGAIQTYSDYVVTQGRRDWMIFILVALAVTLLVQVMLGALREWTVASLKSKIGVVVAARAFEHVLFLPLSFFAQRNAGEVVSRMRIGSEIGGTVAGPLAQMLPNIAVAGGYLAIIWLYDAVLGGIVTAIALANLAVLIRLSERLSEATRLQNVLEGTASGVATAGFMAFDAFRLLGREALFGSRWLTAEEAALDAEQRLGRIRTAVNLGPAAAMLLISMCVLGAGAFRVMQGDLALGGLLALQVLAGLVAAPVAAIATHYCALQESAGALLRLDDLIDHAADTQINRRASVPAAPAGETGQDASVLRLEGLSFGFGTGTDLFSGLDLAFSTNELAAITGVSGAGKSTLARLAAGLVAPRAGRVLLRDRSLGDWPHESLRGRLQYVPQASAVMSGTIRDNITMWDETIGQDAINDALELAGAQEMVARAGGLSAMLSADRPGLSGGEIQRLALARALARRPEVLVLDETTSALDALSEQRVLEGLTRCGAAVLLVSHRSGSIRRCDRVLHLDGAGGVALRAHCENESAGAQGVESRDEGRAVA
ncbi:cysteine peptidase family C39 domain-containing protein [Stappia sp. ES.058]|uniref:cysteine peptidase family C39 domain-containing protein n=1 Tax=Stappia sp. ES.058 TaxID=1881061 RepID=UPI0008795C10|nr:cysteine peptidase family C39 domain-containing protein [Stappia sp. ES.058]SDU31444.1 ABC-type bacteriocin/lantibiotic exporter, contains an N-terminal double-glycine peptidase domain [Stappia sp. ES.058]